MRYVCVLLHNLSYGIIAMMESQSDPRTADFVGESDSERRRRRRRRRKKKEEDASSVETAQLFRLARWSTGGLVMMATWIYGFYLIDKLSWSAAIFFPAGIAAMLCVAAALSIFFTTLLVVVVAFLLRVDSGLAVGLRDAGIAFMAVGALHATWRLFVFLIVKREVTRTEAGYK